MHALLIDRANWCWEVRLSERTYWDCDHVPLALNGIVNGRATSRAEVKRNSRAGISDAHECRRRPFDLCALAGKAGLDAKDTSCSTLASQAMADGDPERVYSSHHGELPATTRCCPNRHSDLGGEIVTPNVRDDAHHMERVAANGRCRCRSRG
jgi:hypothetical protein